MSMMSVAKKRALSQELEFEETKLPVPPSRPTKPPTKRRKTEEAIGNGVAKCNYVDGDQRSSGKGKRQAWTAAAIEAFFEGLCLHGKHFLWILKHMQSKQKKLSDPLIPNLTRDQVRFFYYRTWHKVESHLEPACDPSKKMKPPLSSSDGTCTSAAAVDGEKPVDTCTLMEECEIAELASPKKPSEVLMIGGGVGDLSSFSPNSLESSERIKEQVGASPSTSSDKGDSKVKGVVVNGVKQSLDLVALICYHKLKQKCQVDHNFWKRLSELIYQGTTTIPNRVKGKRRIQIKVPNCGALRGKLRLPMMNEDPVVEQVDESPVVMGDCDDTGEQAGELGNSDMGLLESEYSSTDGPPQVTLELRPLTNASWAHVQGMSQNPRIRITIGSCRRLVELLQILSLRWKIDKATINIYHTYAKCRLQKQCAVTSNCSVKKESCDSGDCGATKSSASPISDMSDEPLMDRIREQMTSDGLMELSSQNDEGIAEVSGCAEGWCLDTAIELGNTSTWQLEYNSQTTIRDLHNHFCQPDCIQLLYSIPLVESKGQCSSGDKLKLLLKIVDLITKESDMDNQDQVGVTKYTHRSPVKVVSIARQSPKVVEYMKSLERRSPRKSPLAKYHKLRTRSPYRVPINQLKPKRVQLDFSTCTPPATIVASSPMSVLSTITISKASPEIIQLSKPSLSSKPDVPEGMVTAIPCSFTTVKLQNVLSKCTNSTLQSDSSVHPLKISPCVTETCSTAFQATNVNSPSSSVAQSKLQLSTRTLKWQPSVTTLSRSNHIQSHSSPVIAETIQPQLSSYLHSDPISAIALQPGHHILNPNQGTMPSCVTVTPITNPVTVVCTAGSSPRIYQPPVAVQTGTSQQVSTSSQPIVSALKPFSKPRRTKKAISRSGQTRQLVPRPLPFLPQSHVGTVGAQSHHGLLTSLPASVNLPSSVTDQRNVIIPNKDGPSGGNQDQTSLVLTLLQAVIQQQRQLKQRLKLGCDSTPKSTPQLNTGTNICEPLSEVVASEPRHDTIPGSSDNLLDFEEKFTDSCGKMFNTSSDTVNNLLRGLSCTKESESIKKLTEETANVLPTFAKVLGQSSRSLSSFVGEPSNSLMPEKPYEVEDNRFKVDASGGVQSQVPMSELLGNLTDSTFKQMSEREDILENVHFGDVFSQLREVLKSPEKLESDPEALAVQQTKEQSDESMSSIGCLLDYLNSAEEAASMSEVGVKHTGASQMGDPTYHSLMEESSVDYIQKFKELASSMDKEGM